MRGFGAFLRKEFVEIARTWRIWALPGMVLFMALTGPVLAKLTPDLIRSMSGTPGMGGIVIEMPDPTWTDSYAQWVKNLTQLITWALIIILGGMISSERKSGTAILVLTKPISRPAFVLAKFTSHATLLVSATLAGAAATWAVTLGVFGQAPLGVLARVTGLWLAFALLVVGVMTLASALVDSQMGSAFIGFGVLVALTIAGLWGPAVEYSPAGLVGAPSAVLLGQETATLWPLVTTGILLVACVFAAVRVFAHKEL